MTEQSTQSTVTQCPFCKEDIQAEATVCRHCGSRLKPHSADHGGVCPFCKETIHPEATRCKHCRSDLTPAATRSSGGDCGCGGGCGGGCRGGQSMGMLPQYAMPGPAAASFQPAFRERYGVGGECYNRCMLYCSGPACDWICSFICEHAPVTTRPVDPVFLTR